MFTLGFYLADQQIIPNGTVKAFDEICMSTLEGAADEISDGYDVQLARVIAVQSALDALRSVMPDYSITEETIDTTLYLADVWLDANSETSDSTE